MVNVEFKSSCDSEKFYTYLIKNIIEDIEKSEKKKTTFDEIKDGYSYTKRMMSKKKRLVLDVRIIRLIENELYEIEYSNEFASNHVIYKFSLDQNNQKWISYFEESKPKSRLNQLMNNLTYGIRKKSIKRKIIANLLMIENGLNETNNITRAG